MKKYYLLIFCLPFLLFSCKKETPGSKVTACDVKDPVRNLPWLKDLIENTGSENMRDMLTIRVFEYNGEHYFDYSSTFMSCRACVIYDCSGNRLEGDEVLNEHTYAEFIEALQGPSSVVVWKGKDAL